MTRLFQASEKCILLLDPFALSGQNAGGGRELLIKH